jgi:hypothetical protein
VNWSTTYKPPISTSRPTSIATRSRVERSPLPSAPARPLSPRPTSMPSRSSRKAEGSLPSSVTRRRSGIVSNCCSTIPSAGGSSKLVWRHTGKRIHGLWLANGIPISSAGSWPMIRSRTSWQCSPILLLLGRRTILAEVCRNGGHAPLKSVVRSEVGDGLFRRARRPTPCQRACGRHCCCSAPSTASYNWSMLNGLGRMAIPF